MKNWVKVALNAGYWFMYLLLLFMFFLLTFAMNVDGRSELSMKSMFWGWLQGISLFALIPGIIGFYGGYGYLFPRFIQKRKIKRFFIFMISIMLIGAIFSQLLAFIVFDEWHLSAFSLDVAFSQILFLSFVILINGVIGIVMRGFIASYDDILVKEQLMEKNKQVEMELVRAQLNPHFLFNTINNIDVMITQDPQRASECLVKLSEMMRYMLYESKDERVDAGVEINYIQQYIELQKLRTDISDFVMFELSGDWSNHLLAPMTLIPFIENAFKHAEHVRESGAVRINLLFESGRIYFNCINRISNLVTDNKSGGLGNELIEKRLQLLYGDNFTLNVILTESNYEVKLNVLS